MNYVNTPEGNFVDTNTGTFYKTDNGGASTKVLSDGTSIKYTVVADKHPGKK